ncbi:uncharacterized protein N7529_007100, partial [Penicillium soppii]|uniref:uncharacterized protein n=1 Tax=Penicillium soppii TaxID=69789 RepID=UPI00254678B0
MTSTLSRVKQEQLRKRCNNLLRRHNDFWRLYAIRSWLVMEMPNKRIYTYSSHPEMPVPTREQMKERPQPAVHKTPADYILDSSAELVFPKPPVFNTPERQK